MNDIRRTLNETGRTRRRARGDWAGIFGYDVFISFALGPPPRGSRSYASDLSRKLREAGFTVFFSEDEAPVGSVLDSTLKRALLKSRVLVVVANRGTLCDPRWMRSEVEEFRQRHPQRPVVPIDLDGSLQDPVVMGSAEPWLGFRGKIWVDEQRDSGANGVASDAVVERLVTAPSAVRSIARLRLATIALIVFFAALAGVAFWQKTLSDRNAFEATMRRLAVESQAMTAGSRSGGPLTAMRLALAGYRYQPHTELLGALQAGLFNQQPLLAEQYLGPIASRALAISPDGTRVLYAIAGTFHLADAIGESVAPQAGDPSTGETYWRAAFNRDGRQVAMGRSDGAVKIVDVQETGLKPVLEWQAHEGIVYDVAFSPDGRHVVSAGEDGKIFLWDAMTGTKTSLVLAGHKSPVARVAISADGQQIVSLAPGDSEGKVRIWSAIDGRELAVMASDDFPVAVSRDAHRVAIRQKADTIRIWDTSTRQFVGPSLVDTGHVARVEFSPDGRYLLSTADPGNRLTRWDTETGRALRRAQGAQFGIASIALFPDGRRALLSTSDSNGKLRILDLGSLDAPGLSVRGPWNRGDLLGMSGDGRWVVLRDQQAAATVLRDVETGQTLPLDLLPAEMPFEAVLNANGTKMVSIQHSSERGDVVQPWDLHRDGPAQRRRGFATGVFMLGGSLLSADGSLLVTRSRSRTANANPNNPFSLEVRLWDLVHGRPIGKPIELDGEYGLAVSPVAPEVAMSDGRTIFILDARSATTLRQFPIARLGTARHIAYSLNGRYLAAGGGASNAPTILDAATGNEFAYMPGAGEQRDVGITAIAFSWDGKYVTTANIDRSIRVWDAATGQPMGRPLAGHPEFVSTIAFSNDGKRILSVSLKSGFAEENTLLAWDAPAAWPDLLCARVGRNFSLKEWQDLVGSFLAYRIQCAGLPIAK